MYSWIFISLLSIVAPALSLQVHPRHSNNDAKRIARALEINADDIFPPHAARDVEIEERGLFGALGTIVGGALDGVATILDDTGQVVGTVLNALDGNPTTIISVPPVVPSSTSPRAADPPPAATPTSTPANGNGNGGTGTTSAGSNNNGNANNGNNGSNNSNPAASAAVSGSGNSANQGSNAPMNAVFTGTIPILVTDHEGHTHTVTGTGAITLTWVTTLPNGVVSTVTEVITPTITAGGSDPNKSALSASKIAAVVGTLVTVFLIVFVLAFILLLARKKRRAMQRANSNRDSSLSFGTSEMVHTDDTALLHPAASTASFRTAPCNIDGQKLDFPLPPVPSASGEHNSSNQLGTVSSGRPISMSSEGFDLLERRSRTSLIAERNFYRKIGQYPEAGTYTPFAVPPSDYNPSDEGHAGQFSPSNLSAALERTKSTKSFHEVWRGSKIIDTSVPLPASENPFSDPSPVTPPAPAATTSSPPSSFPGAQGRPGLWRKATFGSSKGVQPSIQGTLDSSSDSPVYTTAESNLTRSESLSPATQNLTRSPGRQTIVSIATTADYETATEAQSRHTSESMGNFSYHSAFARYAGEGENPFSDQAEVVEGRRGSAGTKSGNNSSGNASRGSERVTSSGWRPTTAKSTAEFSVMSSSASSDANRDMGSTPDPSDLFYHPPSTGYTDRPNTGSDRPLTGDRPLTSQASLNRLSQESGNATSEGEKTIRQAQVSYPSLSGAATRMQGTASTWRPVNNR